MSAVVLVSGALFRAPERKMSKANKPYVAATIRAREGDGQQFWKLLAFNETAQNELMRLGQGDAVSVQGLLKADIYTPENGEPRLSMSVLVDQALAARPKPRQRKSDNSANMQDGHANPPKQKSQHYADPDLDDEVPWR